MKLTKREVVFGGAPPIALALTLPVRLVVVVLVLFVLGGFVAAAMLLRRERSSAPSLPRRARATASERAWSAEGSWFPQGLRPVALAATHPGFCAWGPEPAPHPTVIRSVPQGTRSCRWRRRGYVVVDGVEEYHGRAVAAGTEIVKPLRDGPWGMRELGLRTSDGQRLMIGRERTS